MVLDVFSSFSKCSSGSINLTSFWFKAEINFLSTLSLGEPNCEAFFGDKSFGFKISTSWRYFRTLPSDEDRDEILETVSLSILKEVFYFVPLFKPLI